jgi:hypothetical protein
MIEEIRNGSVSGIALTGVSVVHKVLSGVLAFAATALLIVLPNI